MPPPSPIAFLYLISSLPWMGSSPAERRRTTSAGVRGGWIPPRIPLQSLDPLVPARTIIAIRTITHAAATAAV